MIKKKNLTTFNNLFMKNIDKINENEIKMMFKNDK